MPLVTTWINLNLRIIMPSETSPHMEGHIQYHLHVECLKKPVIRDEDADCQGVEGRGKGVGSGQMV